MRMRSSYRSVSWSKQNICIQPLRLEITAVALVERDSKRRPFPWLRVISEKVITRTFFNGSFIFIQNLSSFIIHSLKIAFISSRTFQALLKRFIINSSSAVPKCHSYGEEPIRNVMKYILIFLTLHTYKITHNV